MAVRAGFLSDGEGTSEGRRGQSGAQSLVLAPVRKEFAYCNGASEDGNVGFKSASVSLIFLIFKK